MICSTRWRRSRSWKSRSARASFRRRKWRIPPVSPSMTCAERSGKLKIPSAPNWITSSKIPPPTNSCRTPSFRCATDAMWCRFAPSTAVRWAASSTMFRPPAPRSSWSPPLWWKPTRGLCSCAPRNRKKSPGFSLRSRCRWAPWSHSSPTATRPCCRSICCWQKPVWPLSKMLSCRRSAIPCASG